MVFNVQDDFVLIQISEQKTYFQGEGILCGEEVSRWLVSARHPLKFVTLLFIIYLYLMKTKTRWKQKHHVTW